MTSFADVRGDPVDVLLVEDNPGDVRLIEEAFAEVDVEVTFHTATDGDEALTILHECTDDSSSPYPDLVLLDLNLPRVNGFDVLEALRTEATYPPIPVIVLTGSEAEEDVRKSYRESANAYLTKPAGPDEFVDLAEAVEGFWLDTARLPPTPC